MYSSQGPPPRSPEPESVRRKRPVLAPLPPPRSPLLEMRRRRRRRDRMISGRCSGEGVVGVCLECPVIIWDGRMNISRKGVALIYHTWMSHVSTAPSPRRPSILSRNPSSFAVTMDDVQEFQESTTIKFEWTLKGLKQLFESRCAHTRLPHATPVQTVADSSYSIAAVEGKQSPRSPRA
jgi:hypothetical protein